MLGVRTLLKVDLGVPMLLVLVLLLASLRSGIEASNSRKQHDVASSLRQRHASGSFSTPRHIEMHALAPMALASGGASRLEQEVTGSISTKRRRTTTDVDDVLSYSTDSVLRVATVMSMDRVMRKADLQFMVARHELAHEDNSNSSTSDVAVLHFPFATTSAASAGLLTQNMADFGVFATNPATTSTYQQPQYSDIGVIPVAIASIVPVFYIPGLSRIIIDRVTLSKIFLGDIRYWDDAAITATNPGTTLPHQPITVVVDSQSLMINTYFSQALGLFYPTFSTRITPGSLPDWCEGTQVSSTPTFLGHTVVLCRKAAHSGADFNYTVGKGLEGVELAVKSLPYSLGYTFYGEALYRNLTIASMINTRNEVVEPGIEAMKRAFLSADDEVDDRWSVTVLDSQVPGAWPIVTINYFVFRRLTHINNCAMRNLVADYLIWFHSNEDMSDLLGSAGLAPLSDYFRERAITQVKTTLKCLPACTGIPSAPCTCLQDPSKCIAAPGTAIVTPVIEIYYENSMHDIMQMLIEAYHGSDPGYEIERVDTPVPLPTFVAMPLTTAFSSFPDFHAGIVPTYQLTTLLKMYPNITEDEINFISVPAFQTPLGITFNLGTSIKNLLLSPAIVAKILNGTITTWNHAEIQTLNPTIATQLPNLRILLVVEFGNPVILLVLSGFLVKFCGNECDFLNGAFMSVANSTSASPTSASNSVDELLANVVPMVFASLRAKGVLAIPRNGLEEVISQVRLQPGAMSFSFVAGQSAINTASLFINGTVFGLAPQDGSDLASAAIFANNEVDTPLMTASKYLSYSLTSVDPTGDLQPGIWPLGVGYVAVCRKEFTNTTNPVSASTAASTMAFLSFLTSDKIAWKLSRTMDVVKPRYADVDEIGALLARARYDKRSILDPEPECSLAYMNVTFQACSSDSFKRKAIFFWNTKSSLSGDDLVCVGNEDSLLDEDELPCDHLPMSSPLGRGLVALVFLCTIVCFSLFLWLFRHRKTKVMITSQPLFIYLFIFGAIFFILSALSLFAENTVFSCRVRPWFIGLGFTEMFAPLLMKLQRVDALFNNPTLKKVVITNKQVLLRTAGFYIVDLIILNIWYAVKAPVPITVYEDYAAIPGAAVPREYCAYTNSAGFMVYMVWKLLIMLIGVILAIKTWNVSHEYSEAKFLAVALYNSLLMCGLVSFILMMMNISAPNQVMLLIITCTYVGMISVILVVVPKILGVAKEYSESSHKRSAAPRGGGAVVPHSGNGGRGSVSANNAQASNTGAAVGRGSAVSNTPDNSDGNISPKIRSNTQQKSSTGHASSSVVPAPPSPTDSALPPPQPQQQTITPRSAATIPPHQ